MHTVSPPIQRQKTDLQTTNDIFGYISSLWIVFVLSGEQVCGSHIENSAWSADSDYTISIKGLDEGIEDGSKTRYVRFTAVRSDSGAEICRTVLGEKEVSID